MTGEQDDDVRSEPDTANETETVNDDTDAVNDTHAVNDADTVSDGGAAEDAAAVEDSDAAGSEVSLAKASTRPVPRTKSARANSDRPAKSVGSTESVGSTVSAGATKAAGKDSAATKNPAGKDSGTKDSAGKDSGTKDSAGKGTGGKQISITVSARAIWRSLVALVVVAALVGVAVLGWFYYQAQQRLNAFDEAKDASAIFAQKLTSSMNADTVANMKDIVGPLTTGEYRKHLESQLADTTTAIQKVNVKNTKVEVQKVSVTDFDTDHADTMAMVQVTGTSTIAPQGGTSLLTYSLKLDKVDGKWLVSDVEPVQAGVSDAGGSGGGGGAPGATTPAPAPAPAPAPGG